MKRDAPAAAMRIAVPVASVKKRRKTIFFGRKLAFFSIFLAVINGPLFIKKLMLLTTLTPTYQACDHQ